MPDLNTLGRWLLMIGLALLVVGGLLLLLNRLGIKNLPGTLRFETQGITCIFPLLASVVLSILLTVLLNLLARYLNR
jgi:hypothetical protein